MTRVHRTAPESVPDKESHTIRAVQIRSTLGQLWVIESSAGRLHSRSSTSGTYCVGARDESQPDEPDKALLL